MKKFALLFAIVFVTACDPLATCEDSEFPEFCGSESNNKTNHLLQYSIRDSKLLTF